MRAMNIRVVSGLKGIMQLKASFTKNWVHYLQEASGLAIFMISACFFGGMLEAKSSSWHLAIPNDFARTVIMGIMMGSTALFIFYSPLTAPSGSHINPAVTITFLRLGKMCKWDSLFYIIFQFIGGLLAVYIMAMLMGTTLTEPPVNYVATVPGKLGATGAAITEFVIAFIMISMVLFTSASERFKKYTRIISGCFVCIYVIIAGPVSGFGMNPARSFASAFPAHIYTAFWIYMIIPFAGMLAAAEFFLLIQKQKVALG
ncbi:MAG TPA: aquaporin [Puia sp.]|nr:aquaporin [Puia sp.]